MKEISNEALEEKFTVFEKLCGTFNENIWIHPTINMEWPLLIKYWTNNY